MKSIVPFVLLLSIVCTSCHRDDEVPMYWNQTYCAEPWGNENNSDFDTLKVVINDFLTEKGIQAVDIVVDEDWDLPQVCLACTCLSGVRIEVWVQADDIDEMEEIGFYQT